MSRIKATGAVAALAVVAATACNRNQSAAAPPSMPPTPVALSVARVTPIDDATEYVGMLKSLHSAAIQPQVDGQITQIMG